MIYGNTTGIKDFYLKELEALYDIKIEKGILITEDVALILSEISNKINREINLVVERNGNIEEVSIGDHSTVELSSLTSYENKLSGNRIIHTHPNGNPNLSNVDISALVSLKLDCVLAIGTLEGNITGFGVGFCVIEDENLTYEVKTFKTISNLNEIDYLSKIRETEKLLRKTKIVDDYKEHAILVGIESLELLDELNELAIACNVDVVGTFFQKKNKPDNSSFLGSGKAKELGLFKQVKHANLIIFDDELTGLQVQNLERITNCKVIDRTTLILEIFATRAKSKEAKIQVELAQLKYRSKRLLGFGITMSKLGGGIGTKGPGEKKLEIDRRRIKENISFLKNELENVRKTRMIQREKRDLSSMPNISLVGYTNSGKSTLRNALVSLYSIDNSVLKEDVFVKDMLFATLDTSTKTISLFDKRIVSISDTVGFIRKLPHDLIESFKSTLEEVIFSDLLLHVVDASSNDAIEQILSVENVLHELNALDKKTILVLNKIDLVSEETLLELKEKYKHYNIVAISAKEKLNIDELIITIQDMLPLMLQEITFLIPYSDSAISSELHRCSNVKNVEFIEEGIRVDTVINKELLEKYSKYIQK